MLLGGFSHSLSRLPRLPAHSLSLSRLPRLPAHGHSRLAQFTRLMSTSNSAPKTTLCWRQRLAVLHSCTKSRLSVYVAFSAVFGYVFMGKGLEFVPMSAVFAGTYLLSCGANAINRVLEIDRDALMDRTKNRPLPAKRIAPIQVTLYGIMLIATGTLVLHTFNNDSVVKLGLLNVFLYGVYTALKPLTTMNTFMGAIVGAVPPLMGSAATGGDLSSWEAIIPAAVLYLWQISHFAAIAIYRAAEYKAAGFLMFSGRYAAISSLTCTAMLILLSIVGSDTQVGILNKNAVLGTSLTFLPTLYMSFALIPQSISSSPQYQQMAKNLLRYSYVNLLICYIVLIANREDNQ